MFFEEKNKPYEAFPLYRPDNYVMLEAIDLENDSTNALHFFDMKFSGLVRIGRGIEADLTLKDKSISRLHAKIRFVKGRYYLENGKSRYGSLVLVQKPIILPEKGEFLELQIGKTFLLCRKGLIKPNGNWLRYQITFFK